MNEIIHSSGRWVDESGIEWRLVSKLRNQLRGFTPDLYDEM